MSTSKTFRTIILPLAALLAAMATIQAGVATAKTLFPIIGAFATSGLRLTMAATILVLVLRPWRNWPAKPPILPLLGVAWRWG